MFASEWNLNFTNEENNIYYKTPEHLNSYYNILEDRKKYGLTVLQNWEVSRDVRAIVEDASRSTDVVILTNPLLSLPLSQNLSPFVPAEPHPIRHTLPAIMANFSTNQAINTIPIPALPHQISSTGKLKRKRVCKLCESSECSGSSKKEFFSSKCGRCLQQDCTGRHIKQPVTGKERFQQPYPCINI